MNKETDIIQETTDIESKAEGLYQDACSIIEQAQATAYRAINETLIKRNWLLGMRIHNEVLRDKRAEYGEQIIKKLAQLLTVRYGEGFKKTNLYNYIGFYQAWPEIFHAASGKSEIVPSLTGQSDSSKIVNAMSSQSSITDIFHSLRGKSFAL